MCRVHFRSERRINYPAWKRLPSHLRTAQAVESRRVEVRISSSTFSTTGNLHSSFRRGAVYTYGQFHASPSRKRLCRSLNGLLKCALCLQSSGDWLLGSNEGVEWTLAFLSTQKAS